MGIQELSCPRCVIGPSARHQPGGAGIPAALPPSRPHPAPIPPLPPPQTLPSGALPTPTPILEPSTQAPDQRHPTRKMSWGRDSPPSWPLGLGAGGRHVGSEVAGTSLCAPFCSEFCSMSKYCLVENCGEMDPGPMMGKGWPALP